jgi:hypothetical protein
MVALGTETEIVHWTLGLEFLSGNDGPRVTYPIPTVWLRRTMHGE